MEFARCDGWSLRLYVTSLFCRYWQGGEGEGAIAMVVSDRFILCLQGGGGKPELHHDAAPSEAAGTLLTDEGWSVVSITAIYTFTI